MLLAGNLLQQQVTKSRFGFGVKVRWGKIRHREWQSVMCISLWRHHCHMGTAIKHPMPDRVKPSFVIFDIRALWRSALSVRMLGCQKLTRQQWVSKGYYIVRAKCNMISHMYRLALTDILSGSNKNMIFLLYCDYGDIYTHHLMPMTIVTFSVSEPDSIFSKPRAIAQSAIPTYIPPHYFFIVFNVQWTSTTYLPCTCTTRSM